MKKETFTEIKKNICYNLSHKFNMCLEAPDTLQISITNRCNFKCLTCSVNKYRTKKQDEPSAEILEDITKRAIESFKIRTIIITGGEPLLNPDRVIAIAKVAKAHNINTVLTTNAYFLPQHAEELVQAGITHFHISIDGKKETHNFLRQNDKAFEMADESLKILKEIKAKNNGQHNFSVGIAMLILKNNIKDIKWLYEYGIENNVDILDMLVFVPDNTNFDSANKHDLLPDKEDMKQFRAMTTYIRKNPHPSCRLNPCLDVDLIEKYYTSKITNKDWKCFAGYKNFFITLSDPYQKGRFEPCLFLCKKIIPLADFGFDLKKIWHSKEAHAARKEIKRCQNLCFQLCFSVPKLKTMLKQI